MGEFIDPRTRPWGWQSQEIYEWMRAQWEANVPTHSVPNTEPNRIAEYLDVTQWWRERFPSYLHYSLAALIQWIKQRFDQSNVNQFDNRRGGRF